MLLRTHMDSHFIRRNPGDKMLFPFLAKELDDSSWYSYAQLFNIREFA